LLTTIVAFAFVLGVLVFVHELGHFLAAKRVGIRVLKFQLGFNPTIFSFRYGDTEYGIGALPLGGYVKMAGESTEEERAGHPDEFLSKSKWQRFQVLIMGPVMNLILAVVVLAVVLYQGAEVPAYEDQPPVVGAVVAGSPAELIGIQPGDRLTTVGGSRTSTWQDFQIAIGTRANRETTVGFVRNGAEFTKTVTPKPLADNRFEIGDIGVLPDVHPRVWPTVNKGDPGDRAGIQVGDVILAVDGQTITFREQLIDFISKRANQPVTMLIQRGEERIEIHVTPERRGERGALGVYLTNATRSVRPGVFEALAMSVRENVQGAGLIFRTVWGLLTRETSPKQLLGPVGIAQLSGEFARVGWIALLGLMANLSLNLGLVNLLPIPVLDGGHIFIMAIEGLARRDFSVRVKEKMLLAGFVVLMMLMVTVIYNDLTRISWIERLMPWRN
jgi:regulator of sigma E protease